VNGRALVTGGAGFAGQHLLELLPGATAPSREELELLDADALRTAVRESAPDVIWHLAALASVGRSWEAPAETIAENVAMTVNLLEAVRTEAPEATVVLIGTGEVYGPPARLPVDEDAPLRPQNPYAVSKAACDLLGGQYADATGLRVVRLRPFNHAGPGQSDDYVVGTLTRQVAEAEAAGREEAVVRTGNADSARDFSDVRDVARAYLAAAGLDPGVYNVASGRAVTVRELIDLVRAAARIPVRHEVDPARVRAHDVPEVRGSAERLRAATGWTPEIPLDQTVADALDGWRQALSRA
jgi:GDP-4-dehydro-6-deoxy-D-mannose reductase